MKNLPFIIFILIFLLTYSCAGKPDAVVDEQHTVIDEQLAMINEQLALINEQLAMLKNKSAENDEDAVLPEIKEPVIDEERHVKDEEHIFGDTHVTDEEQIIEEDIIVDEYPAIDEEPLIEEAPVVDEEIPSGEELIYEEESAAEEEPVVEEELLAEEGQIAQEEPVVAQIPLAEEAQVEETPLVEQPLPVEEPPAAQKPVIAMIPLVEDMPLVELPLPIEEPPAGEELIAEEEPPSAAEEDSVPFRRDPVLDLPSPAITFNIMTPRDDEVILSRIVRADTGQLIEIPFRGTGWVYLGELASLRGIAYNSRRYDPEGQSFIFLAEKAGDYILKFFRQDFIRDYIIYDHVQVIIDDAPAAGGLLNADRSRVAAQPRWPSSLDEAQIRRIGDSGSRTAMPAEISSAERRTSPESAAVELTAQLPLQTPAQGTVTTQGAAPTERTTPTQGTAQSQETAAAQETAPTDRTAPIQQTVQSQGTTTPAQGAATAQITPVQRTAPAQGATGTVPATAPAQEQPPAEINISAAESDMTVIITDEPPVTNNVTETRERLPPEEIIRRAKEASDAGNTAAAIALLDQYMEDYPSGSDEVYWLYGQLYEANTPSRNILLAINYYRRLAQEYPQSSRINDARRRITYIERFYINIQ